MSNYDYTKEEVKRFPLDLRICFHLAGWNKAFKPKDAKDWADNFAYVFLRNDEYDEDEQLKAQAFENFTNLYSFIKELLNEYAEDSCGCLEKIE
jgi:hypothetical protein